MGAYAEGRRSRSWTEEIHRLSQGPSSVLHLLLFDPGYRARAHLNWGCRTKKYRMGGVA